MKPVGSQTVGCLGLRLGFREQRAQTEQSTKGPRLQRGLANLHTLFFLWCGNPLSVGANMFEWILTVEVPLLIECLCALARLTKKRLVGGASDGNSHIAGMFCLLLANVLAATPSSLCEAFAAYPLLPWDSTTSMAVYVWRWKGVLAHYWKLEFYS